MSNSTLTERDEAKDTPFSYVIEAVPTTGPITEDRTEDLSVRVFRLLSFARGTNVGVGPIVGLDASGSVVWAEWAAPRVGSTYSRHRWCWEGLVAAALPALFAGIDPLGADQGLERCLHRAIALQLGANNGDVELDVRIPLACSGLELVAWSVLRHYGWLTAGTPMSAAGRVRLLLQWAGIPTDIPISFSHLLARKAAYLSADAAGPEVVFEVRNKSVHPPKNLRDPEWPNKDELREAWLLATWYLELAILRVLSYDGEYTSRLVMTGWVGTTERVPWA